VPGYTRHQLKEDKFAETAKDAAEWATGHRKLVVWLLGLFVLAVLAGAGIATWRSRQMEQGNDELAAAMRVLNAPLSGQATPGEDALSFNTTAERGKAAEKKFKEIEDKYSLVPPGKIARYLRGVALLQAGDSAGAEQEIRKAADSGDRDLAAVAKMALASIYRNSNRPADAAKIYRELEDHPAASVSKTTAQLALAEMYETTDPQQAKALYQQVQKENPNTAAGQVAGQKLSGGK
jgi:TolA-binding protein